MYVRPFLHLEKVPRRDEYNFLHMEKALYTDVNYFLHVEMHFSVSLLNNFFLYK